MKIYSIQGNPNSFSSLASEDLNNGGYAPLKPTPSFPAWRLLLVSLLSVLGGGFHFGFQMAIINPMSGVLQEYLTTSLSRKYGRELNKTESSWIWSTTAGLLFIGAAIGAIVSSYLISRQGPAKTLLYSAIWLLLSAPTCGLSSLLDLPELFILGRLFSGVGIGFGMTAHGIFLTEISPVQFRGIINSFGGFSINIGYISANFLGLPFIFGNKAQWPVPFFLEALPNILLILGFFMLFEESPVYSLRLGDEKSARKSLGTYFRGEYIENTLEKLKYELKFEEKADKWAQVFTNRISRRALMFSCILNCVVGFSGITAVSFFGTFLLESIGFSQNQAALANCLAALAGTFGAIVGTFGLDRIGRRFLVIGSLLALAFINTCMMLLVAWFNHSHQKQIAYGFLGLFIAFLFTFSAGVGPTAWFLGSELSSASSRAKVQSASVFCQYISCFISPLVYYPLSVVSPILSFLLFILPLSVSAVLFYRHLPETKRKSFDEIHQQD